MEINKQLFEDVLSGKLKGMFVLRINNIKVNSDNLKRNNSLYSDTHPYRLFYAIYNPNGKASLYDYERLNDIIDFIPDTDMKENELTIEIPNDKVVDWEESKKQNKIVLKDKQLTYEDVCDKLFKNREIFFTGKCGGIKNATYSEIKDCIYDENNATTEHQLKCILAKNKLANVATFLNDDWKPDKRSDIYYLNNYCGNLVVYLTKEECSMCLGQSIFKTEELAQQAIEILGEETVKLALEPLGI